MRNKRFYYLATLIVTSSMLVFTGCSKKAEPVISESVEEPEPEEPEEPEEQEEPATPSNQGESTGEVVQAEKPVEEGDPANGSDVAGMDNEEGLTDEEINAEVIDAEDSIDSEYTIIPMDDTQMFATTTCNIRSGAGVKYSKVGSLSFAQEVTVNGKVESEDSTWYVLKTSDGSTQMVSSSLLSATKPQQKPKPASQPAQQPQQPQQPAQPQQPSGGSSGGVEWDGDPWDEVDTDFDWGLDPSMGGLH